MPTSESCDTQSSEALDEVSQALAPLDLVSFENVIFPRFQTLRDASGLMVRGWRTQSDLAPPERRNNWAHDDYKPQE